jgi:NADPH:quinone reductase-like Zn-dependent oxidoreductase
MTVAICHPSAPEIFLDLKFDSTTINDRKILFGLVEPEKIDFYKSKGKYDNLVLVEKIAFSCNFRDKALITQFHDQSITSTANGKFGYSGFGSDFVGRIIEVGKNIKTFQVGDIVIPDATFPVNENGIGGISTNYASLKYELFYGPMLMKISNQMPFEVAASFTVTAQTVYSMLRKLKIRSGMNVLITAASSNTSLFAIQILKNMKVNIYVATTSNTFIEKTKDWGITALFDIANSNLHKKHLGSKFLGFDAVIDPFFDIYFSSIYNLIKNGGKYITCGLYKQHTSITMEDKRTNISLHDAMLHCIQNNISIIGNCLGNKQDLIEAVRDFNDGKYQLVIDSIYSGNSFVDFINRSFNSKDRFGKVIYKYN